MPAPSTTTPALRWGRAALLSAVALGTGVVAHVSAQGRMPGTVALLLLYAATTAGAAALLGRPATTTRIVVLLLAGQTWVHGVLTAMSGHRGDPPLRRASVVPVSLPTPLSGAATGSSRRGSYYELAYSAPHPGPAPAPLTVPAPVQHLLADLSGPHAVMALAHLAAAVVVGLWLALGERALWAILTVLVDGVRGAVRGWSGALAAVVVLTAALADRLRGAAALLDAHRDRATTGLVLARAVRRRGPPVLLAG